MSTTIRPEISKRKPYWIDKHRYYELKHFCLQYPIWKKELDRLDSMNTSSVIKVSGDICEVKRPVEDAAIKRECYKTRIDMLENAAKDTDPELGGYILKGILSGLSFDRLYVREPAPCSKDRYYELYRKFFWVLSSIRK